MPRVTRHVGAPTRQPALTGIATGQRPASMIIRGNPALSVWDGDQGRPVRAGQRVSVGTPPTSGTDPTACAARTTRTTVRHQDRPPPEHDRQGCSPDARPERGLRRPAPSRAPSPCWPRRLRSRPGATPTVERPPGSPHPRAAAWQATGAFAVASSWPCPLGAGCSQEFRATCLRPSAPTQATSPSRQVTVVRGARNAGSRGAAASRRSVDAGPAWLMSDRPAQRLTFGGVSPCPTTSQPHGY